MNYVEHLNMYGVDAKQIPSITGAGVPTTSTEGAVGCLYMDTTTGSLYKCTAATDEEYIWEFVGGNIVPITGLDLDDAGANEELVVGTYYLVTEDYYDGAYFYGPAGSLCVATGTDTLEVVSKTAEDYIIAKGTTLGWIWEKWDSGKAVCWEQRESSLSEIESLGDISLCWAPDGNSIFPFEFAEIPNVYCTSHTTTAPACYVSSLTTKSYVVEFLSTDASKDAHYSICVVGRWK